jgi:hypothetical protein
MNKLLRGLLKEKLKKAKEAAKFTCETTSIQNMTTTNFPKVLLKNLSEQQTFKITGLDYIEQCQPTRPAQDTPRFQHPTDEQPIPKIVTHEKIDHRQYGVSDHKYYNEWNARQRKHAQKSWREAKTLKGRERSRSRPTPYTDNKSEFIYFVFITLTTLYWCNHFEDSTVLGIGFIALLFTNIIGKPKRGTCGIPDNKEMHSYNGKVALA